MDEGGACWSVVAGVDAIADSHGPNGLEEELADACELHRPREPSVVGTARCTVRTTGTRSAWRGWSSPTSSEASVPLSSGGIMMYTMILLFVILFIFACAGRELVGNETSWNRSQDAELEAAEQPAP